MSLQALLDGGFPTLTVFIMTWTVMRRAAQIFCQMTFKWDLTDASLRIRLGSGCGEVAAIFLVAIKGIAHPRLSWHVVMLF